jgi:NTP pyrophosphatase (non-canonical NTP hydrolase)
VAERFNKLTPEEDERLAILLEECGEVLQIIGKIKRHGYESYNPFDSTKISNRRLLEKELGDVTHAMQLLSYHSDINMSTVKRRSIDKQTSALPYLHHTKGVGK